jgi:hypothetical protein
MRVPPFFCPSVLPVQTAELTDDAIPPHWATASRYIVAGWTLKTDNKATGQLTLSSLIPMRLATFNQVKG